MKSAAKHGQLSLGICKVRAFCGRSPGSWSCSCFSSRFFVSMVLGHPWLPLSTSVLLPIVLFITSSIQRVISMINIQSLRWVFVPKQPWAEFLVFLYVCVLRCWVVSDPLKSHGLYPARLLCPWTFPGKNSGVGFHLLLQGILQN